MVVTRRGKCIGCTSRLRPPIASPRTSAERELPVSLSERCPHLTAAVAWAAPWICVLVVSTLIASAAGLALNSAFAALDVPVVLASPPAGTTGALTCEPTDRMMYVASLNECVPVGW
jgi:hypothetical protein